MKQISRLPDAELEVMQALWAVPEYPARTSDLAARLDRDWKAPSLMAALYPEKELSREDIAELERILEKGGK